MEIAEEALDLPTLHAFILKFHFKMRPIRDSHEIVKPVHLEREGTLPITGLLSIVKVGFRSGFPNKHAARKERKGLSLVSCVGPGGDGRREHGLGTKEGEAACGPGVPRGWGVGRGLWGSQAVSVERLRAGTPGEGAGNEKEAMIGAG